jgi:hypothetical protein
MLVSGILGDGLTFLLRSRRSNPTSGPLSPLFMVRIYKSPTSKQQDCTTDLIFAKPGERGDGAHNTDMHSAFLLAGLFTSIMSSSSSQSDIAGVNLPDLSALSLSYLMVGALRHSVRGKSQPAIGADTIHDGMGQFL